MVETMRKIIVGLSLSVLAGCTSVSDLEKSSPVIIGSSKKPPKDIALCVFPKWQEKIALATMSETVDGYRLVVANNMNRMPDELLQIKATANGSSVSLFERMAWFSLGRDPIKDAVHSCL